MLRLILVIVTILFFPCQIAWPAGTFSVTADSAILIDAHTGQVLYEKNAYQLRPPASTTKIATALVTLEMGELDDMVTVSKKAAAVGESSMHLVAGEKLTLEQLLTGALIRSGNDACVAIAEHLAGSEELFARLVTGRVNWLGARETSFVNSNGLPAKGHLSSAYDLALITRYALLNPSFCKIVGTRSVTVQNTDNWIRSLTNTNKLLWKYPGATGVKTGTTNEAGQCLVASATRNGRSLIAVILHSDDRYRDSIKLLEFGFNCFEPKTVIQEGEVLKKVQVSNGNITHLPLVADRSLVLLRAAGKELHFEKRFICTEKLEAPIHQGSKLGQVQVFQGDKLVGYANLVAKTSVKRNPFALTLHPFNR